MYLGICLIAAVAAVWAVTSVATRPRACTDRVTQVDVERLLRAHPLPDATIARVLATAAERRMGSRTLWSWADTFGADRLVLALDAEVAEARMRRHLEAGSTPDWDAMVVFAALNSLCAPGSLPFAEVVDPDAIPELDGPELDVTRWETPDGGGPATADLDLSQFDHLPPIYDPGLPLTRFAAPPGDATSSDGGDPGWPQVA